jgi:hypothetical protein
MLTKKKWFILVTAITFIVLVSIVLISLRATPVPIMNIPVGQFAMDDLSLLDRSTGDRLSVGMKKEDVKRELPLQEKYYKKGQMEFMYDYNEQVEYINAISNHDKFVTPRGIRNGDKQSKVLERYGLGTFELDPDEAPGTAYSLLKVGEVITFIDDSESLAEIEDESLIYTLYFFWTEEKHPKVKSIMIGQYSKSPKDSKAEGIKRIRESALNIPETAQEIISLYDRYLEQSIVSHIQFENYQITFEKYQQLDKLSLQIISNLMIGLNEMDDNLYPPEFKKQLLEFIDEGKRQIEERSQEERVADEIANHKITISIHEYRKRFGKLALQFDCAISSDSFIDVQIGF